MQSHRNQGSIFQHFTEIHIMKPPLQKLLDQTEILHKETDFRKLQISEAVSITCQRPSINNQQAADFILPSARPQDQVNHPPANSRPAQAANQDPGRLQAINTLHPANGPIHFTYSTNFIKGRTSSLP
ncbi:hypothetical protein Pcinc_018023 [Petrolisthes cinctipes]|uniref:Uncharacterized protein n=1 Tax=Petrolisthes cinctipes TaxID=88211 RepID=A0AAE1KMW5_PETCI|nr:hypothetical protein Pcinc_018023 [Petrolisthes cinctipes]